MPFIDVSDLLCDPDFSTLFTVKRTASSVVDGYGVRTTAESDPINGVVLPMGTKELIRLPEADRVQGQILVYTQYRLTSGEAGTAADIVRWRNNDYTVVSADDYSEFGAGYIEARCKLNPVRPAPAPES